MRHVVQCSIMNHFALQLSLALIFLRRSLHFSFSICIKMWILQAFIEPLIVSQTKIKATQP